MDSQFSDTCGVTTFRRCQKRHRSPDPELGLAVTIRDASSSSSTENIQKRKRNAKNMHLRKRKCAEKDHAPPNERDRSCGQREQFCEESKRRASKNGLSMVGDSSSNTYMSYEIPEESTCSGKYFLRKHKKLLQDKNSSLDLQAITLTATNQSKTVSSRNSKMSVSSNHITTVQQAEVSDNSALSLQGQFFRRCKQSLPAATGGRILRSNVSGSSPLMTAEQASTSRGSSSEALHESSGVNRMVPSEAGGSRRKRSVLHTRSIRPNPSQNWLDTEAAVVETARLMHFTVLLSVTNTERDASSIRGAPQSIASLHDLLSDYLNLDAGLNSEGLSTDQINRLPTLSYCRSDTGEPGGTFQTSECQICLCAYEQSVMLRKLPCFHEFHSSCIDRWLKINRSCPICRSLVSVDSADH